MARHPQELQKNAIGMWQIVTTRKSQEPLSG